MALKKKLPEYNSKGTPDNNFRYPEDLQSRSQKSYIHIETYKEDPLTLGSLFRNNIPSEVKKDLDEGRGIYGAIRDGIANAGENIANEGAEGARTEANLARAARAAVNTFNSAVTVIQNADFEEKTLQTSGERALLYLPLSVVFPDGVSYENADLGNVGALAEKALGSGSSVAGAVMDIVKGGAKTLVDAMSGNQQGGAVGSLITQMALKKLPSDFAEAGALQTAQTSLSRVTTNPNARVLFKGVSFREFTFQFKLIASSKYEAEQIEGMIKWLRINMYPDTIPLLGVSMGYQFPPRFMIKMMHRDDTESTSREIFNKIKPAYLKSVSTTYNSTQQSFHIHNDGSKPKPFEVDLTLSFQESRQLEQKDIREGY
ncbi:hypothetical protein PQZ07_00090 [bacterium]|nr:hypothetical protein [bacterium]